MLFAVCNNVAMKASPLRSRTIYIDESGYSGSKFVDDEKPLFVLASLRLAAEEAKELKREFFAGVIAPELKHSKIVGSRAQRSMVLAFLSEVTARESIAKVWVAEKRYAAWLKIVDYIVEPYLQKKGRNIYRDGGHLGFASMLYHGMQSCTSADYSDGLLTKAVRLMKSASEGDRRELHQHIRDGYEQYPAADEFLPFLDAPIRSAAEDHFERVPSDATDLALGAAVQLMGWWRTETTDEIHVVHDATANMSRRKDIWDALTDRELAPYRQPWGSGMVVTYPIAIASTTFDASEGHDGLQLTDVLAGAIGCMFDVRLGGERADYAKTVLERISGLALHAVMPSSHITPDAMGTRGRDANESLDYLAEQYRSRNIPHPRPRKPR
jgi:hypothetical protein